MFFKGDRQLINIGASGLQKIAKGCQAYGDTSKITGGELGENLSGDISGLSGIVDKRLSGVATGITLDVTGQQGDIRIVLARKERELRRTHELDLHGIPH